jgi:hypothetical protein
MEIYLNNNKGLWLSYTIMICLRHNISYLCPSHTIFQRHLEWWLSHHRCFYLLACHISKYWTSHSVFVFSLPTSTEIRQLKIYVITPAVVCLYEPNHLHMTKHINVRTIIITAATDAPTATPKTSPSISHCAP